MNKIYTDSVPGEVENPDHCQFEVHSAFRWFRTAFPTVGNATEYAKLVAANFLLSTGLCHSQKRSSSCFLGSIGASLAHNFQIRS